MLHRSLTRPIIIVKTLGIKLEFSGDENKQVGRSKKTEIRIVLALYASLAR